MIWRNVQTLVIQAAGSCRGITAIIIPINQFVRIHKGTREAFNPEESLAATSNEKKRYGHIDDTLLCFQSVAIDMPVSEEDSLEIIEQLRYRYESISYSFGLS